MASVIPRNVAKFSLQELMDATGARLVQGDCREVVGVSTDTRTVEQGSLFVALSGEKFDGHRFVQQAVDSGALAIVVERPVEVVGNVAVLQVDSCVAALGDMGQFHRLRWGGPVVAVAGSVGKTTTRSCLAAVLTAMNARVHCPPGNLNNTVGVPLVLLGLTAEHTVSVVELGTSLPGEVAHLVEVARPNVAILTKISIEHSEGLGDLDAIEQEEGDVLCGLLSDALAVVNADDERCVRQLARRAAGPSVVFGAGNETTGHPRYSLESCIMLNAERTEVRIRRPDGSILETVSPLLGAPGGFALTASLAAAEAVLKKAISSEQLQVAMASQQLGEPGRLCPIALADGSLVLDDTYNSSPASVLSSVQVAQELANRRNARLVLVLGEMRELGERSAALHAEVGEQLSAVGFELLIAFGGDAQHFLPQTLANCAKSCFEKDPLRVAARLARSHCAGDVILVKSSRGLRAERIVQHIVEKIGKQP